MPLIIVAKAAACPECGGDQTIASWAERPAPIHTVRSALDRPDLYRRTVRGVVATAGGLPWLRPGVPATMTFGPDNVYLVATASHGGRDIEGIDYADIEHLGLAAVGRTVESLDTVVNLRAGPRELSLRTSAFDTATLERLLDPVQIRIDAARRAPRVAPPVPLPPPPAPTWFVAPPTTAPPPIQSWPTERVSTTPATPPWRLIGAGAAVLLGVIALVAWVGGGSNSTDTRASRSSSSGTSDGSQGGVQGSSGSGSGDTSPAQQPRPLAMPPLVAGPDGSQRRESCTAGFDIPNASGWASHTGRGTDKTSCQFAFNVGAAYWQMGTPSAQPRRVVAQGAVDCQLGGDRCQGNLFVMNCQVFGSQDWITCEGGNNAVVYLFGE